VDDHDIQKTLYKKNQTNETTEEAEAERKKLSHTCQVCLCA
jgi:hypothetical protein